MGRLRRNREPMTCVSIPVRLRNNLEQEKYHNETIGQRIQRIYNLYHDTKNDARSGVFWYEQYENMRNQVIELESKLQNIKTLGIQTYL